MTGLALAPLLNGSDKGALASLGAQAAPALMSGKLDKLNQGDIDNIYSLLKGPIGKKLGVKTAPPAAVNSSSEAPPTAPGPAAALTVTPDQLQFAMQKLGSLEARNNELQAQLTKAHQAIQELKSSPNFMMGPAPTTPTPSFMTSNATAAPNLSASNPLVPPGSVSITPTGPIPMIPAAQSKIFVPGSSANSLAGVAQPVFQTETPRYATPSDLPEPAPTPNAPATPPNLSVNPNLQSMQSWPTGVVKLELEGVNASMTDIKLKVVLRNEQNQVLTIPSSAQAVVRMSGRPDRKAKVTFPSDSIPAHGEVRGVIKVSGHDLNPSADVFIPLTTASGSNEIHLTVPISSL